MKRAAIAFSIVAFTALIAGVGYSVYSYNSKPETPVVSTKADKPTVQEMHRYVNIERAKAGVKPLKLDKRIIVSAQRKADDMKKYDYYGHVSPRDKREGYAYVFDKTGSLCITASENLGINDYYSDTAVSGWMKSTAHRKAMLNPKYSLTGFGVAWSGVGYYTVQHFCETK